MTPEEFRHLLDKQLQGRATSREVALIERFSRHFEKEYHDKAFTSERHKNSVYRELRQRIHLPQGRRFTWWKVAAGLLLLMGLGVAGWYGLQPATETLSTATGERSEITLSDGSIVHLNAESTLKYPANFDTDRRAVQLQGEAYFEVASDPERPFTVSAGALQTTVRGTSFNLSAYAEDSLSSVALVEGEVEVAAGHESRLLAPGQEARIAPRDEKLRISDFDPDVKLAWRQKALHFDGTSFREMARILKREFGIHLQFDRDRYAGYTISGRFENPEIQQVLQAVAAAKNLHYRQTAKNQYLFYEANE